VRNSLLASVGSPDDFSWRPDRPPRGFLAEPLAPPPEFQEVAREIRQDQGPFESRFQMALAISRHLTRGDHSGGAVQSTTLEAYRKIVEENRGYCSDYTQVFNGIAHAAEIPVREWGMSFEGFSGRGHAFSEIFDDRLDRWIFLDNYNSFYVVDPQTGSPLSVLELRERLRAGASPEIRIVPIDPPAFGFRNPERAVRYYRRGADEFFLYQGNNVFSYDEHPLVRLFGPLSRAAEQAVAILAGVHPRIRIYPTETNRPAVRGLRKTRALFLVSAGLGFLAAACLPFQFRAYRRLRRSAAGPSPG
jgi:hypothetical protein